VGGGFSIDRTPPTGFANCNRMERMGRVLDWRYWSLEISKADDMADGRWWMAGCGRTDRKSDRPDAGPQIADSQ
jgi:hypothetical protein